VHTHPSAAARSKTTQRLLLYCWRTGITSINTRNHWGPSDPSAENQGAHHSLLHQLACAPLRTDATVQPPDPLGSLSAAATTRVSCSVVTLLAPALRAPPSTVSSQPTDVVYMGCYDPAYASPKVVSYQLSTTTAPLREYVTLCPFRRFRVSIVAEGFHIVRSLPVVSRAHYNPSGIPPSTHQPRPSTATPPLSIPPPNPPIDSKP
jgi:hypothetical protein